MLWPCRGPWGRYQPTARGPQAGTGRLRAGLGAIIFDRLYLKNGSTDFFRSGLILFALMSSTSTCKKKNYCGTFPIELYRNYCFAMSRNRHPTTGSQRWSTTLTYPDRGHQDQHFYIRHFLIGPCDGPHTAMRAPFPLLWGIFDRKSNAAGDGVGIK